jgi:hypothetical protein
VIGTTSNFRDSSLMHSSVLPTNRVCTVDQTARVSNVSAPPMARLPLKACQRRSTQPELVPSALGAVKPWILPAPYWSCLHPAL